MNQPTIVAADHIYAIASCGNVMSFICRGKITVEIVQRMSLAAEDMCTRYPGAAGFINVIEQDNPTPDGEVRRHSAELLKRISDTAAGIAVVVEGSGLRMSLMRNVLSTISLMSRSNSPMKYFETTAQAALWLSGVLNRPNEEQEICEIAEYARRGIRRPGIGQAG